MNVARAGNVSAILHCEVVQTVVELLSSEDDFVVEFACKGLPFVFPVQLAEVIIHWCLRHASIDTLRSM